jgi:hypothetical protein
MKKYFVRWIVALLLMPGLAYAQAQPVSKIQSAITALIQNKAIKRGFAANDPRINATIQAGGAAVIGMAASAAVVTAAGVTAPAWLTAAVVMGLGTLFSVGVSIAIDYAVKWFFNSDGSIGVAQPDPLSDQAASMTVGGPWFAFGRFSAGDKSTAIKAHLSCPDGQFCSNQWNQFTVHSCYENAGQIDCRIKLCHPNLGTCQTENPDYMSSLRGQYFPNGAPNGCPAGQAYDNAFATCFTPNLAPVAPPPAQSPTEVFTALPDAEKAKALNPAVLAAIAELTWKKASEQPGYEGLPYVASDPITAAEVQAYQQANPSTYPTVADAIAPQPSTSGAPSPFSLPSPSGQTGTTTPPSEGSSIDWSISGGGGEIPKQAVAVSYTPTIFAAPTGCPAPVSFSMFGKQYAISYGPFCDLMTTVAPIFLALGAAAAALIFAESLKS